MKIENDFPGGKVGFMLLNLKKAQYTAPNVNKEKCQYCNSTASVLRPSNG